MCKVLVQWNLLNYGWDEDFQWKCDIEEIKKNKRNGKEDKEVYYQPAIAGFVKKCYFSFFSSGQTRFVLTVNFKLKKKEREGIKEM